MYPGVIVEYNDLSDIPLILPVTEVRNAPLYMAIFTSDKGPEEWTRISGKNFFSAYGNTISYARHGQPLLQAAMSINAGADLLCKRLVADDAMLANIGIFAKLDTTEVQATDDKGKLIYVDADGNDTTVASAEDGSANEPKMVEATAITYRVAFAPNCKDLDDVKAALEKEKSEGEYLLYAIADNGRGISKKRIKIIPNYKISKSLSYVLYTLSVLEGNTELESMTFSINPDLVVNGENISLQYMIKNHSTQLTCVAFDTDMREFVAAVAEKCGAYDEDTLWGYDVLFGYTNRGIAFEGVVLNSNGIDLQNSYGQALDGGVNGVLGAYPFKDDSVDGVPGPIRAEYIKQAKAALDGSFDTVIFNVDQYMIHAVIDANYPKEVKRAIEALATFREDFVYFRDMGLGKTDLDLIWNETEWEEKNMFCASYCQSYDILDPYTKKQIPVTIGYDIAQKLVAHYNNGYILPPAGMKFDMTIDSAIYGTLSFAPTVCPDPVGNQKEKLDDMRVNYASYIDNQLVIESLYTSQDRHTQWSYINNVMGIQDVVRAIRTRCPIIRYTFIDGEDLERYKADVEEVLAPFQSDFKQLSVEYLADATYSANKIFYATLKVVYRDFVQTEWFKITALNAVEVTEA